MSEPTRRLAVLGDGDSVAAIRSAATAAGARLVDRSEADAIVAVGEAALRDAMRAVADGDACEPAFEDGYAVQRVRAASGRAAGRGEWVAVE